MRAMGIRIEYPGHELKVSLDKGLLGYALMLACEEEDREAAVEQLLALAAQIEKVAAAFAKPIKEKEVPSTKKFWVVWSIHHLSTSKHKTRGDALDEARRLVRKEGSRFYVLEADVELFPAQEITEKTF